MTAYTVAPLSDTTWLRQQGTESTRFSAKWASTEDLLVAEVDAIRGRDLVLELDVSPRRCSWTIRSGRRSCRCSTVTGS